MTEKTNPAPVYDNAMQGISNTDQQEHFKDSANVSNSQTVGDNNTNEIIIPDELQDFLNEIRESTENLQPIDEQAETDTLKDFDYRKLIVDSTKPIKPPQPILIQSSTGIPLFHYRNVSLTGSAQKVGKTKENMAFVAAILHRDGYLDFHCPNEFAKVLFCDTEQDESDTLEFYRGVNKLIGQPTDTVLENLLVLNLRDVEKADRPKYVESAIIDFKPDFITIDGVVDLCTDFNSIEQSHLTTDTMARWSTKYNCHIHLNLHVNKGNNNQEFRGHLGSFLRQKGESTVLLSKKHDGTIFFVEAKQIDSRHRPIETYYFNINNEGLPELYKPVDAIPRDGIFRQMIIKCFENDKDLRYNELVLKIMTNGKVKIDAAKGKIKRAKDLGFIRQNDAGLYILPKVEEEQESIVFE